MRQVCWLLVALLCCGFTAGEEVVVKGTVKASKFGGKVLFRPDGATTSITVPETSVSPKVAPAALLSLLTACLLAPAGCGMTFATGKISSGGIAGNPSGGDTTAPTVTMTAPAPSSTVSGATVTVSATAADNVAVSGVQFKLDGATLQVEDTASPFTISWDSTTASNASHTLTAVARDAAGNTATAASISVTVNNVAPPSTIAFDSVSLTPPGASVASGSAIISHTVGANSNRLLCGSCMEEDTAGSPDMTMTGVTYNGVALTLVLSQDVPLTAAPNHQEVWCLVDPSTGTHDLVFSFTGTVNAASCGAQSAFNAKQELPHLKAGTFVDGGATPTVISVPLTTTTNGEMLMDFAGSASAESFSTPNSSQTKRFDTAHTPGPGDQLAGSTKIITTAGAQTHQWTSSDTARMGLIVVALRDINAAAPPDTTNPSVALTAPVTNATVSGSAVTISATASDDIGVVGVQFKLDGSNLSVEDTTSPYSISWNSTGASDGAHTLSAVARDAASNTATAVNIAVTVDNTAPVISSAMTGGVTGTSATLTWLTNEPASSIAEYGTTTGYGATTGDAVTLVTNHSVSITGLSTSTLYHVRPRSTDAGSNLTIGNDLTFTTTATSDTTFPVVTITAPSSGAVVAGTISVNATCTDNVACVDVQFKLDGANLGALDTTSPYSVSWNTASTTDGAHTLTAVGRDAVPNSTTSPSVNVTVNNGGGVSTSGPTQPLYGGNEASRWAALVASNDPWWQRVQAEANLTPAQSSEDTTGMWGAIAYKATGNSTYLAKSVAVREGGLATYLSTNNGGAGQPDQVRDRFPSAGPVYYFQSPGLTTAQRSDFANVIHVLSIYCTNYWNQGLLTFDTDQLVGCTTGILIGNQAILDDGRATSGEQTTASNDLANGATASMKARLETTIAHAAGGTWMEGSGYNPTTNQYLMLLAAQTNNVAGLDAYMNALCRAELRGVTYNKQRSMHWGDVEPDWVGGLVEFKRTPLLWQCTSLSGTDGTNAHNLLNQMPGASFGGGGGNRGALMARPDLAATSYSMDGVYLSGQGILTYHTSNSSFFTQAQPWFASYNPINDHEVYFIGDWYFYKNGTFIVPSPWGYDSGGNFASSRFGFANTLLVDGQASMSESRGILSRDTDGPCYGQGSNSMGNRYTGQTGSPNRWVHNWEEWTLFCPAGASGIDVIVHFTSVYKDSAPTLFTTEQNRKNQYEQYRQMLNTASAPTIDNSSNKLVTWTNARAKWFLPTDVNLSNAGNEIRAIPATPTARQFFLYVVATGGTPSTLTYVGDTLTIGRAGESTITCTTDRSTRTTSPSTVFYCDGGNCGKVAPSETLFQTYGHTNSLTCQ